MKKIVLILLPLLLCIGTIEAKTFTAVERPAIETEDEESGEKVKIYSTQKEETQELTPFKERRVDREINKRKFIYKGELMVGVSASYNTLNSTNAEILTLLTDMNVEGSIISIKPYMGYFYRDNRAIGVRYGYVEYSGTVESSTLDLGTSNDMSFDVPYVNLLSVNNSYSLFHRAYAPLDDKGNFGVFAEVELALTTGHTSFEYENNGVIESSYSKNRSYDLNFNPGIAAFVMRNVCASLSFQFGGLNYTYIKQYNENNDLIGTRESSKMRFNFNAFAVNFGIAVHLW
ncbi:MAG: hypothetical protein R3Y39_07515 [Rikenellaceae bacterium]